MKKKIISVIIIAVLAMLVMGCGYCFNRLIRHEKAQSLQIASLMGAVSEVKERLRRQQEYFNYDIRWSDDDFNFLVIIDDFWDEDRSNVRKKWQKKNPVPLPI